MQLNMMQRLIDVHLSLCSAQYHFKNMNTPISLIFPLEKKYESMCMSLVFVHTIEYYKDENSIY